LLSSCRSPEQVQEVSDMIDKLKASVFTWSSLKFIISSSYVWRAMR
jgi:hypothetical protein